MKAEINGTHTPPATGRRVAIETHGCKLNQADSQQLAQQFLQVGYRLVAPNQEADVYVVNTCTVTHVADRKARNALWSGRRRHPQALVVATGCYVERAPRELEALDGVHLMVGNRDKASLVSRIAQLQRVPVAHDPERATAYLSTGLRTRALVKIQEGCNQVCAYCIVPRVRGREHSIPPEALVQQIQEHVAAGRREVVLTGSQLGSYGFDLPGINLAGLLRRILEETSMERLRVSSLQPQEIADDLLPLWSDPRLCPHFHMPLQSGSDAVLSRMRRRYTAAQYAEAVKRIRRRVPDVSITADVIVGFPGETPEAFEQTYAFCQQMGFADLHIFPYSVRPGTSAAHFAGHVDAATKRRRMERMLELAREQGQLFRQSQIGKVRPVLWEVCQNGQQEPVWVGLTDNYIRVAVRSAAPLRNDVSPLRLERVNGTLVWGALA